MQKIPLLLLASLFSTPLLAIEKNLNIYQNAPFQYNEFGKLSENNKIKIKENTLSLNYPYSSFEFNIEGVYPERIFSNTNYDSYDIFKNNIGKNITYDNSSYKIYEVRDNVIYLARDSVGEDMLAISDISKITFPKSFFDSSFYNSKLVYKEKISEDNSYIFSAYDNGINWSSEYSLVLEGDSLNLILYGVLNNNTNQTFDKINLNLLVSNEVPMVRPKLYMAMAKTNDMLSVEAVEPISKGKVEEIYKYSVKNVNLEKGSNYYKLIDLKNVKYTKEYRVDSNIYIFNTENNNNSNNSLMPYVNYKINREDNNLKYEVFPSGQYKISKIDDKNIYKLYNSGFTLNTNKDIEFNGGNEVDSKVEQFTVYNNNDFSYKISLSNYKGNNLDFIIKLNSPNNSKKDFVISDLNKEFNTIYDKDKNIIKFTLKRNVNIETIFKATLVKK